MRTCGAGLLAAALLTSALSAQERAEEPIRILDVVEIRVAEEPSLDLELQVGEDGRIVVPVLGGISVAGLTPTEVKARLESALEASLLQQATVTVEVHEYRTPIPVTGAVARPGPIDLEGSLTLSQALNAAGGVLETAGEIIQLERRADNGLTDRLEVRLADLQRGELIRELPLHPSDRIHVPPARSIRILLMGEIGSRGELTFEPHERATVLTAVARAGGLLERASNKLLIRRQMPDGTVVEIPVRFKQILNAEAPDVPLEDGDIIIVRESFF